MKETLPYKGYVGSIEMDLEEEFLFGRVRYITDIVTYQSATLSGLIEEFEKSVDDYIHMCSERGEQPQEPAPVEKYCRLVEDHAGNQALCILEERDEPEDENKLSVVVKFLPKEFGVCQTSLNYPTYEQAKTVFDKLSDDWILETAKNLRQEVETKFADE